MGSGAGSGSGSTAGAPCVIVVTDQRTLDIGRHPHSIVDIGHQVDLPVDVIRRWAAEGRTIPVTTVNGVVTSVIGTSEQPMRNQFRAWTEYMGAR